MDYLAELRACRSSKRINYWIFDLDVAAISGYAGHSVSTAIAASDHQPRIGNTRDCACPPSQRQTLGTLCCRSVNVEPLHDLCVIRLPDQAAHGMLLREHFRTEK